MKAKITEEELCAKFISAHPRAEHLWYECYLPLGRADMVYKENNIIVLYEAKVSLSIQLLEQCINRLPYAHFVYAVIPERKNHNNFMNRLFQDYGVGVIEIKDRFIDIPSGNQTTRRGTCNFIKLPEMKEVVQPKFNRTPKSGIIFNEENKKEIAGSKHAGITPFGIMIKNITERLSRRNDYRVNIQQAFEIQSYYKTPEQFKSNIYQWCRKGVITDFYLEKGFIIKSDKDGKEL